MNEISIDNSRFYAIEKIKPAAMAQVLLNLPPDTSLYGSLVAFLPVEDEPKPHPGEPYFKHENGNYRSIENRWAVAITVKCPHPKCDASTGSYCTNLQTGENLKYPHNLRFREAQRQAAEKEPTLPLA